jgi:hypothetical protein
MNKRDKPFFSTLYSSSTYRIKGIRVLTVVAWEVDIVNTDSNRSLGRDIEYYVLISTIVISS